MKEVEISLYEINGAQVKCVADSFRYDLRQAFVWAMNSITKLPNANHMKVFLNPEHEDYLCFDKDESGIWFDSTYEYEPK